MGIPTMRPAPVIHVRLPNRISSGSSRHHSINNRFHASIPLTDFTSGGEYTSLSLRRRFAHPSYDMTNVPVGFGTTFQTVLDRHYDSKTHLDKLLWELLLGITEPFLELLLANHVLFIS
jgi:hypothetical protein